MVTDYRLLSSGEEDKVLDLWADYLLLSRQRLAFEYRLGPDRTALWFLGLAFDANSLVWRLLSGPTAGMVFVPGDQGFN